MGPLQRCRSLEIGKTYVNQLLATYWVLTTQPGYFPIDQYEHVAVKLALPHRWRKNSYPQHCLPEFDNYIFILRCHIVVHSRYAGVCYGWTPEYREDFDVEVKGLRMPLLLGVGGCFSRKSIRAHAEKDKPYVNLVKSC